LIAHIVIHVARRVSPSDPFAVEKDVLVEHDLIEFLYHGE
jgi:hypothetical protein